MRNSANGPKRRSPWILSQSVVSICEPKSSGVAATTSSISSKILVARSRSKVAAQALWSSKLAKKATSPCIFTLLDPVRKV